MNNSVFNTLNYVDVFIILTGTKFILHPILAEISKKLPIKRYGFNHQLKLKHGIHKPKPKPKPEPDRLPDDVIVTILSQVDIVTLRSCTLVLSLDTVLPKIVSFSTPLTASLFIPDKSGCWYGKLFNKIVSKTIVLFLIILSGNAVLNLTVNVFWWVNMSELKPEVIEFFGKLNGLKSLEIELPRMSRYDCRLSSHLWFKYDVKFGVYDTVADYGLYVFGDKVDDTAINSFRDVSQTLRGLKTVAYHFMLHFSVMELGCVEGMTVTIKDAERNGSMVMGSGSKRDGGKVRVKILYLPSTLKFNQYVNEEEVPVQVQDVMVLFFSHVDASVVQDDNDAIMACLGGMDDEEGEADQKTELRQIVAEILADESCRVLV